MMIRRNGFYWVLSCCMLTKCYSVLLFRKVSVVGGQFRKFKYVFLYTILDFSHKIFDCANFRFNFRGHSLPIWTINSEKNLIWKCSMVAIQWTPINESRKWWNWKLMIDETFWHFVRSKHRYFHPRAPAYINLFEIAYNSLEDVWSMEMHKFSYQERNRVLLLRIGFDSLFITVCQQRKHWKQI